MRTFTIFYFIFSICFFLFRYFYLTKICLLSLLSPSDDSIFHNFYLSVRIFISLSEFLTHQFASVYPHFVF